MTRKEDLYCWDFKGKAMYCDSCDDRFNSISQISYKFCPFCGKQLKAKE